MSGIQVSTTLSPTQRAFISRLGNGSLSRGLRRAVEIAMRDEPDIRALKKEMQKNHKKIMEILAHLLMTRLDVATSEGASESARRWAAQHGEAVKAGAKSILAGDSE